MHLRHQLQQRQNQQAGTPARLYEQNGAGGDTADGDGEEEAEAEADEDDQNDEEEDEEDEDEEEEEERDAEDEQRELNRDDEEEEDDEEQEEMNNALTDMERHSMIENLIGMGFPVEWALRAMENCDVSTSEAAITWIIERMDMEQNGDSR